MANPGRTQRRAAERKARKNGPAATRDIPPDVAARIRAIEGDQSGGPSPHEAAAAEARAAAASSASPPPPPEQVPGDPGELPPELRDAIKTLQGDAPAPKKERRAKRYVTLERELAILLTLPGPAFEAAGDQYCAMHFTIQGPLLANRLTGYAESHPATAELLERIVSTGGFAMVALAIVSYALPPALHHGLPAPEPLYRFYHVPGHEPPAPVAEHPPPAAPAATAA